MKIIGYSDVITNSSSETFMLKAPDVFSLVKELKTVQHEGYNGLEDDFSGMGGECRIGDWTVFYISDFIEHFRDGIHDFTVKKCNLSKEEALKLMFVDIDWGRVASITYLKDESEILQFEESCDDKFPNHDWAYECFDRTYGYTYLNTHPEITKRAVRMIEHSSLPTIMNYSKFLKNENT